MDHIRVEITRLPINITFDIVVVGIICLGILIYMYYRKDDE